MRWFERRSLQVAAVVGSLAMIMSACSSSSKPHATGSTAPSSTAGGSGGGQKGGTLTVVGSGDVDHFDTASGYYDSTYEVERAISRELYQYPTTATTAGQTDPQPDVATALPDITNGGKTYTIHIKQGVMWDTTPPRQVTAQDAVLGFKRLCNPVSPVGAPQYYTATIVGFKDYCDAMGKISGTAAAIKTFIDGNNISGLKAINDSTLEIDLMQPASDFVNILALPFSAPAPVEDLNYVPASPDLANHWISDGPYTVKQYTANQLISLVRNPAWNASTDSLRKAYVDSIQIKEGVASTPAAAVQQIQAGTADLEWDQNVAPAQLGPMTASNDPNLVIGPEGASNFVTINPYMVINFQSPNNGGALSKLPVRQALEYAINKVADSQVYGGAAISKPLNQPVPGGSIGNVPGYNPYPTPGDQGDPAKAKQLLQQAGYQPGQITLNLVYRTSTVHPQIAQTDQAALQAAGFNVKLISTTSGGFYSKYLDNPTAAKAGQWDIAEAGWIPDWFGNNGRAVFEPLFDGTGYGPNSTDYGDYNSAATNKNIADAEQASSESAATAAWQAAAKQVMQDAAIVPIGAQKTAIYHASRVQNCNFSVYMQNCDFTNVWIKS